MTKKKTLTVIILVAVIAAVIAGLIFELDYFDVIDLDYKPKYYGLKYDQLGSAKKLEGDVAVVSVFVSDSNMRWDFSNGRDIELRKEMFAQTDIALKYLASQAKKYNKSVVFHTAGDEKDGLLYYECDFGEKSVYDINAEAESDEPVMPNEWDFINKNINVEKINQKYGDNIVYLFFMNGNYFAYAFGTFKTVLEQPYEICILPYDLSYRKMTPTIIAHEMLHLFGAVDLYKNDPDLLTNDATLDYVDFCNKYHDTDIMYVTGWRSKYELQPDTVTGEITDITAYYIGWTNSVPFEIDWFRIYHSQHEQH